MAGKTSFRVAYKISGGIALLVGFASIFIQEFPLWERLVLSPLVFLGTWLCLGFLISFIEVFYNQLIEVQEDSQTSAHQKIFGTVILLAGGAALFDFLFIGGYFIVLPILGFLGRLLN